VTKNFPTLYGISSKGVVKVWEISVTTGGVKSDGSCEATIFVKHGQLGGKIQISPETIREGKNIGKANETSPFEQACLEAESKWKKKHDSNYTETKPKLVEGTTEPLKFDGMGKITLKLLPMLAQKYKERKHHIVWPAYIQPKLNGVRCLVQRVGDKIFFWSRKAKLYKNFNLYMEQEFLSFMEDGEILDGEMYNHGDVTFQELMSMIKDEKNPDLAGLKQYVKFHCYDHPDKYTGFKTRYILWTPEVPNGLNYVRLVPTFLLKNAESLEKFHGQFTGEGYEGSIIRSGGNEPYNFQYRDNQLQKHKDFEDAEFKIIGAEEGVGKDEGQATLICVTPQGIGGRTGIGDFGAKCKGPNSVREEQWKNRKKYLGKLLTVRYQTLSDEFIPTFPVGIIVRDYE
jgi:DNA ligase-1